MYALLLSLYFTLFTYLFLARDTIKYTLLFIYKIILHAYSTCLFLFEDISSQENMFHAFIVIARIVKP